MTHEYITQGTCSKCIQFKVENGILSSVRFIGGCDGNLKGIGKLVEGLSIDDVVDRLEGITCGRKTTSCPDQLAQALKSIK
jgi:uncharacterized protein (TIGR03905 family)